MKIKIDKTIYKIILLILIININIHLSLYNNYIKKTFQKLTFNNNSKIYNKINADYDYNFAIIRRNFSLNGLFGFYVAYLGCLNLLIKFVVYKY